MCKDKVSSLLRLEKLAWLDQQADHIADSFASGNAKEMFKCINRVLKIANNKCKEAKLHRVRDSSGKTSQTVIEEKLAFREHFAKLMSGNVGSFAALVQNDRVSFCDRFENVSTDGLIFNIPMISDLANIFNCFAKGKACGEGKLVSDVFKFFGPTMAELFFPLVVKTCTRIQPPLQWKGGMICDLFKGKGSPALINSYRDILLSDHDGKAVQRFLRARLFPTAQLLSADTQFGGGLHGGETAIAHLYLRLFIDSTLFLKLSSSVIFFDVVSAFATLLRRIVFDVDQGDEAWLFKLREAGFPEQDISSIYEEISSYEWLSPFKDTGESLAIGLAKQWYNNSWCTHEFIPNVLNTTAGSAAGIPLADLMYSLAMSRVLLTMRKALACASLDSTLRFSDGSIPLKDVSFVDDMALPVIADSASQIVHKVSQITSIVFVVFRLYGMELNFSPGKSAGIMNFVGAGSKQARIDLDGAQNAIKIDTSPSNVTEVFLRIVQSYKHLGTQISYNGVREEVAYRGALMRSETSKLSRLLRNMALPSPQKINLIQAYFLSKGPFQCGTWPAMLPSAIAKFSGVIINMYRNAYGKHFVPEEFRNMFSNDDLVYEYNLINPLNLIRQARVSLLCRVIYKSPPLVLELAAFLASAPRSWAHTVALDLKWVADCGGYSVNHGCDFKAWVEEINDCGPMRFRKAISKFISTPFTNIMTTQCVVSPPLLWRFAPWLVLYVASLRTLGKSLLFTCSALMVLRITYVCALILHTVLSA